MAWNTGASSPDELEMTCNTSEVAVCCCSDSRSSLSRRVFSIAITALVGEVLANPVFFLGERGPPWGGNSVFPMILLIFWIGNLGGTRGPGVFARAAL